MATVHPAEIQRHVHHTHYTFLFGGNHTYAGLHLARPQTQSFIQELSRDYHRLSRDFHASHSHQAPPWAESQTTLLQDHGMKQVDEGTPVPRVTTDKG